MRKSRFFLICFLISNSALGSNPRGGSITADINCTFSNPNINIALPNFKSGNLIGASPLKDIIITTEGKSITKKTISAQLIGLGSAVIGDSKDQRPTSFMDFENDQTQQRLVIYYCSGSADSVESKLFTGSKSSSTEFKSSNVVQGSCSAKNIADVFTSDCSSLGFGH